LEHDPETARLEAAWRREGLARSLRELLRAADAYEQGDREQAAYSEGIRTYIRDIGRAGEARLLRRLSPEQMDQLVTGEEVPVQKSVEEIDALVASHFANRPTDDERPEDLQRFIQTALQETRQA